MTDNECFLGIIGALGRERWIEPDHYIGTGSVGARGEIFDIFRRIRLAETERCAAECLAVLDDIKDADECALRARLPTISFAEACKCCHKRILRTSLGKE